MFVYAAAAVRSSGSWVTKPPQRVESEEAGECLDDPAGAFDRPGHRSTRGLDGVGEPEGERAPDHGGGVDEQESLRTNVGRVAMLDDVRPVNDAD